MGYFTVARGPSMKVHKVVLWSLLALVVICGAGWSSLDKDTRVLLGTLPANRDLLF